MVGASSARFALVSSDAAFGVAIADGSLAAGAAEGSRSVDTLSCRVAGFALTFVDINATSSRSRSVARSAATLTVAADLAVGTIRVRPTSRPASAIHTDLAGHAVVVAVADLDAIARQATFSTDASVGTFAASRVASSRLATHTSRAIRSLAVHWVSHASLLGSWAANESCYPTQIIE